MTLENKNHAAIDCVDHAVSKMQERFFPMNYADAISEIIDAAKQLQRVSVTYNTCRDCEETFPDVSYMHCKGMCHKCQSKNLL